MTHNHSHGHCNDESHDHDHDTPEDQGFRDNLFSRIDRQNVVALNVDNGRGPEVIKPWSERLDEQIVSSTFHLRFTGMNKSFFFAGFNSISNLMRMIKC